MLAVRHGMTSDLRKLLKAQHAEHLRLKQAGVIVPWVFFRMVAEGRGGEKKPTPIKSYGKAWRSACRAAGCPGRIPHDLRRTAVRNLVRAGIPERVAMKMAGHKTPSVFQRYNIVSGGDLRDAAHKLNVATASVGRVAHEAQRRQVPFAGLGRRLASCTRYARRLRNDRYSIARCSGPSGNA